MNAVKQRPGAQALRLYVGVADSFPKLVTNEILKPVFAMPQTVHVICREGKMEDLLAQLAAHRLDIVLADEPASSSIKFRDLQPSAGRIRRHVLRRRQTGGDAAERLSPSHCTTRPRCCRRRTPRCAARWKSGFRTSKSGRGSSRSSRTPL